VCARGVNGGGDVSVAGSRGPTAPEKEWGTLRRKKKKGRKGGKEKRGEKKGNQKMCAFGGVPLGHNYKGKKRRGYTSRNKGNTRTGSLSHSRVL